MIVKKKNGNWFPAENKGLRVGETIDITDPRSLILNGDVVAVDPDGVEISAYDLYGIIVKDEREEFEEYLKLRKAQALEKSLKAQQEELKKELDQTATEKATGGESKTVTEAIARGATTPEASEPMSWAELMKKGREKGVYKIGMKRAELEAALK